jgi:hypothetical protein
VGRGSLFQSWVGYVVKKPHAPALYDYEDEYSKKMELIKKKREDDELATTKELEQIVLKQTVWLKKKVSSSHPAATNAGDEGS